MVLNPRSLLCLALVGLFAAVAPMPRDPSGALAALDTPAPAALRAASGGAPSPAGKPREGGQDLSLARGLAGSWARRRILRLDRIAARAHRRRAVAPGRVPRPLGATPFKGFSPQLELPWTPGNPRSPPA